ncbi:MAG TPA: phosphotriesterase-related protein [Dehalococcoidia bacterium]
MRGFSKFFLAISLSLLSIMALVAFGCSPSAQPAAKPEPTPPGMINSVLGPISPDKLGQTLIHEHFCFAYPGYQADATIAAYDYQAALEAGLKACQAAKAVGIQTIVDPTPNDTGYRDPLLYQDLSRQTGINIICTTGLYTEGEGSAAYWKTRVSFGADISQMISEMMIKEITEGIGTTGVKAGAIKVGTSPVMTDYEKAVHKAAVMAQKATGVPIITHTEGPTGGVEQAEYLLSQGADPKKLMIGHVTNSKEIDYHRAILAKGVSVGFDRLGLAPLYNVPDSVSVQNIATLCQEGYANKIMLSHDTVNYWVGRPITVPDSIMKMLANWRVDYVSQEIIPALKTAGVTDDQINTIMVENPKSLFLGK